MCVLLAAGAIASGANTYYVDSFSGSDTNTGTATSRPWRSLDRLNAQEFLPGDKIFLKAGTRFSGELKPRGSGTMLDGKPAPIILGRYGRGPNPRLDGEGRCLDTLLLRNVEYWEVQDLEITNLGTNRQPWRTGVHLLTDGFGATHHIYLRRLFVHDVNGDLEKEREGCGIYFESRGGNQSYFDDLLIENCRLERTDRNGICQRTSNRSRSLHVVIRGNRLEDIGGDGIKIWGSNGALVEHNVLHGGRMRCQDYAAGIWPFEADDTVIQFNEVSGMKGIRDGEGFDSDYLCRRSVFQYNYSHDNDGGFILMCSPGNSYSADAIIRYNISQNDGINSSRVFHFGGGASNTQIYNNTIYVGPGRDLPLIRCTDWNGGDARGTHFFNNIFYVDGRVTYDWGKSADTAFDHNVFFGNHVQPPADANAITNRPPLIKPGSGGDGFGSLNGYKLRHTRDFPSGMIVPNNGGRDFFGRQLPADQSPSIGASEW